MGLQRGHHKRTENEIFSLLWNRARADLRIRPFRRRQLRDRRLRLSRITTSRSLWSIYFRRQHFGPDLCDELRLQQSAVSDVSRIAAIGSERLHWPFFLWTRRQQRTFPVSHGRSRR